MTTQFRFKEDEPMAHHVLKCYAPNFQPIVDTRKRSDIRLNDRGFKIGDTVTFREGHQEISGFVYTGNTVSAEISFIDSYGLKEGFVNLSLSRVGLTVIE